MTPLGSLNTPILSVPDRVAVALTGRVPATGDPAGSATFSATFQVETYRSNVSLTQWTCPDVWMVWRRWVANRGAGNGAVLTLGRVRTSRVWLDATPRAYALCRARPTFTFPAGFRPTEDFCYLEVWDGRLTETDLRARIGTPNPAQRWAYTGALRLAEQPVSAPRESPLVEAVAGAGRPLLDATLSTVKTVRNWLIGGAVVLGALYLLPYVAPPPQSPRRYGR